TTYPTLLNANRNIEVGIGDDACIIKDGTIITTDAYIEDIHFSLDYFSFYEIGQRVVCGTLSDIAAMAGMPIAIFVSALLPSQLSPKQLKELYSGMLSISNRFSCEIAGGDIVAYPKLGLILTAIGKTKNAKLRSTATPNEYLYITGYCGLSETGRLALKNKLLRKDFKQSIKRHLCPIPRINEAIKLKKFINALIDTSDGLSTDAFHLAEESKVKIKIFADKIPIHKETKMRLSKNINYILNIALNGGEDYELLFTSPYKNLPSEILGTKITRIGIVEKGKGVYLVKDTQEAKLEPKGYDHFR
ncbi:MAG: thiamine-phosphate kinase, partial [candidate division WOR-3 bacterium]|nr:thiamine-phosphate kinase [candidate division WOR-3 bacterium]